MMKFILPVIVCLLFQNAYSQQGLQKRIFSHEMQAQIAGRSYSYSVYFIIDSNSLFRYRGQKFYGFTFSEDSAEHTGFIRHDKISNDLLYIPDTQNKVRIQVQKLFKLKHSAEKYIVPYLPVVGYRFILQKQIIRDTVVYNVTYTGETLKHDVHIEKIKFARGEVFPCAMTFFSPFDRPSTIEVKSSKPQGP